VEGIDWNYGLLHLRDADLLKDTVIDFYRTIDSEADSLQRYYEELGQSQKALDSYRIKVHAMKSSAALIGASALSGVAKLLEHAARDGRLEIIHSVTAVFLEDWRSYKEKLKPCVPQEEKQSLEDISVVIDLLENLRMAMEDMDIDASDAAMEEVRRYAFKESVQSFIDELSTAVVNLDSERVTELVEQIELQLKVG